MPVDIPAGGEIRGAQTRWNERVTRRRRMPLGTCGGIFRIWLTFGDGPASIWLSRSRFHRSDGRGGIMAGPLCQMVFPHLSEDPA